MSVHLVFLIRPFPSSLGSREEEAMYILRVFLLTAYPRNEKLFLSTSNLLPASP